MALHTGVGELALCSSRRRNGSPGPSGGPPSDLGSGAPSVGVATACGPLSVFGGHKAQASLCGVGKVTLCAVRQPEKVATARSGLPWSKDSFK